MSIEMFIFLTLLAKLFPLYVNILLGYLAGKFLNVKKETIAPLLIYIIVPVVIFAGVVNTKLNLNVIFIPILFFIMGSSIALLAFYLAGFLWKDSTRNILAFTSGTGNTGYFGIPVAIAIFGNNVIGIASLIFLGIMLYETTLGFFLVARGNFTVKKSLMRLLTLPILYAYLLGLLVNLSHIQLGSIFFDTAASFRGAFTILGMMIIGMGLADIKKFDFDFKFIGLTFLIKFAVWPLLMILLIFLNNTFFKIFDNSIDKILLLMAIVPLAANTVSYATLLKAKPEKAALAVLLSTFFALFYIPLMTIYLLK